MTNLNQLFELQKELNVRVLPDYQRLITDSTEQEKSEWIQKYCLALQQEVAELIDCFSWKWWKKQEVDIQNARVEAIDIFHFLISIFQILGMSAQEVFDIYLAKSKLNHDRQDKGYLTGGYEKVVQCSACDGEGVIDIDELNQDVCQLCLGLGKVEDNRLI